MSLYFFQQIKKTNIFFPIEHPWLLVESGIVLEPVKTRTAQYDACLLGDCLSLGLCTNVCLILRSLMLLL